MRLLLVLPFCTGLLAACTSSSTTSAPPTSVEGSIVSSTFALGAPTAIDAIDETGARTHGLIGADGKFRLEVTKAHTYRLATLTPNGEEPVIFPHSTGKLDMSFKVSSNGALVALGAIRHFDAVPTTFSTQESTKTSCDGGAQGADDHADGECVDGKDAVTGAACTDEGDPKDGVSPVGAVDVPDTNPPSDVAGCEDGANDGEDPND